MHEGTLANWVHKARVSQQPGALGESERDEPKRLRKEIVELWMQRDVLKRSVDLWVNEATGSRRPAGSRHGTVPRWRRSDRVHTDRCRGIASQSVWRLVVQTGRCLDELTLTDFDDLTGACRERQGTTGKGWDHYRSALNAAHRVLFHLEVLDVPPPHWQGPRALVERLADVDGRLRPPFVAYLERKLGTCNPRP